ncbi:MAG: hypothetical protein R3E02_02935 [Blastomonas sp.]
MLKKSLFIAGSVLFSVAIFADSLPTDDQGANAEIPQGVATPAPGGQQNAIVQTAPPPIESENAAGPVSSAPSAPRFGKEGVVKIMTADDVGQSLPMLPPESASDEQSFGAPMVDARPLQAPGETDAGMLEGGN